ncbi:hypothetical protein IAR55_003713 [Kwoniella newhampshirensis]|uniref:Uncharacterized protein n=1 Tax=Kwoniella newhampshirensis TaxID=1651941 RepID=A0AAW0Z1E4_9TREE
MAMRLVMDGCDLHRAATPTAGNLGLIKSAQYINSGGVPTPVSTARLLFFLQGSPTRDYQDGFTSIINSIWKSCSIGSTARETDFPSVKPVSASFSTAEKASFGTSNEQMAAGDVYKRKMEKFNSFSRCERDADIGGHKVKPEGGGVFDFGEVKKGSVKETKEVLKDDWHDPRWRASLWKAVRLLDRIRRRETDPSGSAFDHRLLLDNHVILLTVLGLFEDMLADIEGFKTLYRELTILLAASCLSNSPSVYGLIASCLLFEQFRSLVAKSSSPTFSAQYALLNEISTVAHSLFMCAAVGCHNVPLKGTREERITESWKVSLRDCFVGIKGGLARSYSTDDDSQSGEQEARHKSQGHAIRRADLASGGEGTGWEDEDDEMAVPCGPSSMG